MDSTTASSDSISGLGRIVRHLRKNSLLYIFFFIIFFKLLWFAGLSIDQLHLVPKLGNAFYMIFAQYLFRPVFYFCPVIVFLSFSFLFKNRGRNVFFLVVDVIFSALILVDIWYLRGFNAMPSPHLLQQGSNLDNLAGSIFPVIHLVDLLFVIDFPFIIFLRLFKKPEEPVVTASIRKFALFAGISLFFIVTIMPVVRLVEHIFSLDPISPVVDKWDPMRTVNNLSPIGFHIVNTYTFLKENKTLKYTPKDRLMIESWYKENRVDLPDNRFAGIAKGMNLIVIQVESLEAFPLRHKIGGQEITPVLNRLLAHALYFTNFYEQVANGMSSDADLMLNTSTYPILDGGTFFRYPFTSYNSLPKILSGKGYFTSVYHPDNGSFWNWLPALRSIGFESCIDASHYNLNDSFNLGISDDSMLKQVEGMIIRQKRPFYTFIVTLSSHTPFVLPERLKKLKFSEKQNGNPLGRYFHVIHYTDEAIGSFLEKLRTDGLLENTIIVIYGDHEGIHRYFPKEVGAFTPRESWFQTNSRKLPLIIYNPKFKSETLQVIGGQIDLFPTIAYLLGIKKKEFEDTIMGRNLLNTRRSFVLFRDGRYLGDSSDKIWVGHVQEGAKIGDMVIRGNFWKNLP